MFPQLKNILTFLVVLFSLLKHLVKINCTVLVEVVQDSYNGFPHLKGGSFSLDIEFQETRALRKNATWQAQG